MTFAKYFVFLRDEHFPKYMKIALTCSDEMYRDHVSKSIYQNARRMAHDGLEYLKAKELIEGCLMR